MIHPKNGPVFVVIQHPVVTARGVPEPDVVLVPAFGDKMPDTLPQSGEILKPL